MRNVALLIELLVFYNLNFQYILCNQTKKSLSQQFLEVLKLINVKYEKNFQIHSNLDGQDNGILFEFQKNKKKNNWKADALKECIKNASHLRLLAKDVLAKFAIVPLEEKEEHIYNGIDF